MASDSVDFTDTGDDMRARTWDLYDDQKPEARLSVLIGVLGGAGKSVAEQKSILRRWLGSPASRPAPHKLRNDAVAFVENDQDE